MPSGKKILIVVTSHAAISAGHPTGLWFEEFSLPYALFRQQGHVVDVASPKGGQAPIDPRSLEDLQETKENQAAREALTLTEISRPCSSPAATAPCSTCRTMPRCNGWWLNFCRPIKSWRPSATVLRRWWGLV